METDDEACDVDVVGGGHDDVDEIMMDSMFELCAYEGNDYEEEDESDDNNDANVYEAAVTAPANQGGWTYLTGDAVQQHPVVNISIDGVDQQLLAKAREEVPLVLEKIKRKLFGMRGHNMSTVSPALFLQAFLDPEFLGFMKAFINSNDSSNNPVTANEVLIFVRVELMLSFYKVCQIKLF
jgi:hypothetical protein